MYAPSSRSYYGCKPQQKILTSGGVKGNHGNLVIIMANNISGNRTINLQGLNGTTGSNNCSETQPSSSGAGSNGGVVGFL